MAAPTGSARAAPAPRRRWWLRVPALVVVLLIIGAGDAVLAVAGIGGFRWGWLWTALLFVALPVLATLILIGTRTTARRAVVATVALVGLVGAVVAVRTAPLSSGRIAEVLDRVEVPADWRLLGDSRGGSAICLDSCPDVTRTYRAPGTVDAVNRAIAGSLLREGFLSKADRPDGGDWQGHDIEVDVYLRGIRGGAHIELYATGDG